MEKKEYIERGALIEKIKSVYCADCDNWNEVKCRACQFDDAMIKIDSAPAADVVEVVHGEWIESHVPDSILDECSICHFDCGAYSFKYCPNCGAKMDGERKEE